MIRSGRVVRVQGDRVYVRVTRHEACRGCGACGGGRQKDSVVAVYGTAAVGDEVDVEMPDAQVVKASFLSYLVPLGGFLAGLFLLQALAPGNDLASLLGGMAGLAAGFVPLKLLDKRLARKSPWQPRIAAVRAPDAPAAPAEKSD